LRNKLALSTRLRNLNLKSQLSIFDSFRDIRVHIYVFFKFVRWFVGVKVGVANFYLGQSKGMDENNTFQFVGARVVWHSAESNLRCVSSSGICMPNPNSLALTVSEISAFIRKLVSWETSHSSPYDSAYLRYYKIQHENLYKNVFLWKILYWIYIYKYTCTKIRLFLSIPIHSNT